MTLKRSYCDICTYPQVVCICHAIETLHSPINIVVLQHPLESKHAKNSAKLLSLCMDNVEICIGEYEQDFLDLAKHCQSAPHDFALFYPSELSLAIEHNLLPFKEQTPSTLIFIDATWRKALKIWKLNPWLQNLSSWHFINPPNSRYQIRKASIENSLSTLEAVAYALEITQAIDCRPLYKTFTAMQERVFLDKGKATLKVEASKDGLKKPL